MPTDRALGDDIQNPPSESKGGIFKIDATLDEVALAICGPQHNLKARPKPAPLRQEAPSVQNLTVRFGKKISNLIDCEASRRGLSSDALIKKAVNLLIEDGLWGAVLDD